MKKLAVLLTLLSFWTCSLYSQNKTIKGRVIANDFKTVSLVSIMMNDTVEVGKSDLNGFFKIDIPVTAKTLLFMFVGFEPTRIVLADNCMEVEVVMMLSATYDFRTPKKVDKLRRKEFEKLPRLHREAFVKGIFKTEKACYTQEFIFNYRKHKKQTAKMPDR